MASSVSPLRVVLCAVLAVVVGCSSGNEATSPPASTAASDPSTVATTDSAGGDTPSSTAPAPDEPAYDIDAMLRRDDLVILNLLPLFPEDNPDGFPVGMADFDQAFSPDVDWDEALRHLDIYRIHAWQVRSVLTDEQLLTMFAYLDDHGIPLMFETEPLTHNRFAGCEHGESFSGVYDLEMANRISRLGGTIHAVAIEEPYHFVHKLDGPLNCQWPVERIVDEVIDYMVAMREIFPGVPFGTIEPIWSSPETTPRDMEIWLDIWEERSGEPFAFLHIDPDWYRPDWADVAIGIEAVADARDVPFGVLYNGGIEPDGESWMQFTMENVALFEDEYGGTPQHVSFQSWYDQPQRALPPDDLGALTSGITRYFGERTDLDIGVTNTDGALGDIEVALTTADGVPVADVPVVVSTRSLTGALGTHTVTGIVPEGVTEGYVLARINVEDTVPGNADLRLAAISYRQAGGSNLLVNGDFGDGTNGWGIHGDPFGDVTVGGANGVSWLEISAVPEQQVFIDAEVISVTSGAEFEFSATFGILDESVGAVSVAIEFPGVSRVHIDMTPPVTERARAMTDAAGILRLPAGSIEPGSYLIDVSYDGDLDYWPSSASATIEIG